MPTPINSIKSTFGLEEKSAPVPLSTKVLCFLFGLLCLIQVQAANDGGWYFYAQEWLDGKRLYADLHLALQPTYILINAAIIKISGNSYILHKGLISVVLAVFIITTSKLIDKTNFSEGQKTLLFFASFFCGTHFNAFKFDDYHLLFFVLTELIALVAIAYTQARAEGSIFYAYILAELLALSILTRVNDGLMLTFASVVFLLCERKPKHLRDVIVIATITPISIASIIWLTGDSIEVWIQSTILDASAAKGGPDTLILAPFRFIIDCASKFFSDGSGITRLYIFALATTPWVLTKISNNHPTYSSITTWGSCFILSWMFFDSDPIGIGAALFSLACPLFILTKIGTPIANIFHVHSRQILYPQDASLLLFPLALTVSGAMSTAGTAHGLYFPFGFGLILLAIVFRKNGRPTYLNYLIQLTLGTLALYGFLYKIFTPFEWHGYASAELYQPRELISSPRLGPYLTQTDVKNLLLSPVCEKISHYPGPVLSIPYPYVNYVCGNPIWHGYVQTFFDTSTKMQIDQLIGDLKSTPPRYVLYQRQLENLSLHEKLFNKGQKLPHRALDELITLRQEQGTWQVVYSAILGPGSSSWILLDTQPLAR